MKVINIDNHIEFKKVQYTVPDKSTDELIIDHMYIAKTTNPFPFKRRRIFEITEVGQEAAHGFMITHIKFNHKPDLMDYTYNCYFKYISEDPNNLAFFVAKGTSEELRNSIFEFLGDYEKTFELNRVSLIDHEDDDDVVNPEFSRYEIRGIETTNNFTEILKGVIKNG